MATATADIMRDFDAGYPMIPAEFPAVASDIIYQGSAVGDNGSGFARPFVAADPFLGFAEEQCDNSAGAAGAKNVRTRPVGAVVLAVTGVVDEDDVGEAVYATDDTTFTLTASGGTQIGKVLRHISGTSCLVYFEAVTHRSI